MKLLLLFLVFMSFVLKTQAEEALIPQGYEVARYDPIWKKSPFTLSSITQAVDAGFASKLTLLGILKIGQESFVSVMNNETKQRMFLSAKPNAENIQVERVETGTELKQVIVTLKKGSEVSTLSYEPTILNSSAMNTGMGTPQTIFDPPIRQVISNNQQAPPATSPPVRRRIIVPAQPKR